MIIPYLVQSIHLFLVDNGSWGRDSSSNELQIVLHQGCGVTNSNDLHITLHTDDDFQVQNLQSNMN